MDSRSIRILPRPRSGKRFSIGACFLGSFIGTDQGQVVSYHLVIGSKRLRAHGRPDAFKPRSS